MKVEIVNNKIAVSVPETTSLKTRNERGLLMMENNRELIQLKVVLDSGRYKAGDVVYLPGTSATAALGSRATIDGIEFILIDYSQVVAYSTGQ